MLSFKWRRILLCTIFLLLALCLLLVLHALRNRLPRQPVVVDGFLFGGSNNRQPHQMARESSEPGLEINRVESVYLTDTMSLSQLEENFFKYLKKKDVKCDQDRRLGNQHDGGWNVCLSPPFLLQPPCVIYSFGIGNDWRFEDEISDWYGCRVLAFDPSMDEPDHNRTSLIHFERLGLGSDDKVLKNGWRLRRFETHLLEHNHQRTIINYLKFDIEFMEWKVLESMIAENILRNVRQIGFEIHTQDPALTQHINLQSTRAEFLHMYRVLKQLEDADFRKFNYRMNPFCNYISNVTKLVQSRCYELHYVNLRFVKPLHLKSLDARAGLM